MNVEEIIVQICDNANSSLTIFNVFAEAFEERDAVELLKKRAFLIEHCEHIMRDMDFEDEYAGAFKDIFTVLTYENLREPMSVIGYLLTPTHKILTHTTFRMHQLLKREDDVEALLDISEELRVAVEEESDLTKEQKRLLLDVCDTVKQAKEEHDMVGNYAISKLYENLVGKAMIYQEVFSSIKSKTVLEKLKKLYTEAQKVNEVMGFLLSMGDKFQKVLGFLN